MYNFRFFIYFLVMCFATPSLSAPLDTYQNYVMANPAANRFGTWVKLLARGESTDDLYVLEVDPVTGAIPVDAEFSISNDTDYGVVGPATLRTAAQVGNATGAADFGAGNASAQTLRVVVADDQNPIDVTIASDNNYGVVGANTLRTAAQIGNSAGSADFGHGAVSAQTLRTVSVLSNGTASLDTGAGITSTATLRTVLATDQGALPVTQSGQWDITDITGTISLPTGAATESTLASIDSKVATEATLSNADGTLTSIDGKVATETTLANVSADTTSIDATITTIDGKIANDYGASTGAIRAASQIGNATGAADFGSGAATAQTLRGVLATRHEDVTTPLATQLSNGASALDYGTGAESAATLRTVLATRHESVTTPIAAQISNGTTAIDFDSGASSAATVRTVLATRHEDPTTPVAVRITDGTSFGSTAPRGRDYADSIRNNYSSVNVTTGTWVELIASTASDINDLQIFDSCGQTLELGVGAATSESRMLIIPPGGFNAGVPLHIPAGSRVSIRAISANCTSGEFIATGLN